MPGEDFDVRVLRERLGWSRERLASELSVSLQSVYRWETGKTKPIPAIVKQLKALEAELGRKGRRGKEKAA